MTAVKGTLSARCSRMQDCVCWTWSIHTRLRDSELALLAMSYDLSMTCIVPASHDPCVRVPPTPARLGGQQWTQKQSDP